jgi:hypothetical protein
MPLPIKYGFASENKHLVKKSLISFKMFQLFQISGITPLGQNLLISFKMFKLFQNFKNQTTGSKFLDFLQNIPTFSKF